MMIKNKYRHAISLLGLLLFLILAVGSIDDSDESDSSDESTDMDSPYSTDTDSSYSNKWAQGGNLHRATVSQWDDASYQNKLATASDWLAATKWKGHLNSTDDFKRLKLKSRMLVNAVDGVITKSEMIESGLGNLYVGEISASLTNMSDDFSP